MYFSSLGQRLINIFLDKEIKKEKNNNSTYDSMVKFWTKYTMELEKGDYIKN